MKAAIRASDTASQSALLKAIVAMSYAHWEGYVKTCATQYFEHLTLRKKPFAEFERQIFVNSMLGRVDALHRGRVGLGERVKLINDILDGGTGRFSRISPNLIDTQSNLSTDVIKDLCIICSVDSSHFEDNRTFLDVIVLRRRNAIAHGQHEYIQASEIDDFVARILALMDAFRSLLENKIYMKAYAT
jgi:hypothetical protein